MMARDARLKPPAFARDQIVRAARRRAPAALWRAAVLAAAVGSNACLVLSLQPVYDDASVVFDESLLGKWENLDDQTQLTVERGEWRSYRIVFTERGTSRTLNGNLTRLGDAPGARYVDVTEKRGADPGPYLLPVHGIFRITSEGDELRAAPMDLNWFTRAAAGKRRGIPALAIDDRRNVVIASPTAEVRAWLARAPAAAFGTPMTFTRADHPPSAHGAALSRPWSSAIRSEIRSVPALCTARGAAGNTREGRSPSPCDRNAGRSTP